MPDLGGFNYQHAATLKAGLAFLGTLVLGWRWYARSHPRAFLRATDAALGGLGLLAFIGWWNFGAFGFGGGYYHHHEFFHYYLGSKYSAELGYTGLYDCVAAAEVQQGRRTDVAGRWMRDLTTNELRAGFEVLDGPPLCRERFASAERWDEFNHDVAWFRDRLPGEKWLNAQMDHGYNATPVWTVAGRALANTGPVSARQIALLWWIDPLLLLAMWGLVWWAFGWQVMCVALIWWGTNYPARYSFTGGAFLRQDWLFFAVAGIGLARRGHMTLSGFALTWSALLRIFPGFILLGLLLKVLVTLWRRRTLRPEPAHGRFAAGALLALAILVPLSLTVTSEEPAPFSAWKGFFRNSEKLMSTPLTNHVGLPVVMAFSTSGRSERVKGYWLDSPWDTWKDTRRRMFSERRWVYIALVAAFVVLLGFAVQRLEDWAALALGIGAIPFFTELTCYYYGILLGFAFLWPRVPLAGVGLAAVSLVSGLVTGVLPADDDRFTVISLSIVLFVAAVTVVVIRWRQPAEAAAGSPPDHRSAVAPGTSAADTPDSGTSARSQPGRTVQ